VTAFQTLCGESDAAGAAKHVLFNYAEHRVNRYEIQTNRVIVRVDDDPVGTAGDYVTIKGVATAADGEYQLLSIAGNVITLDKTAAGVALSGLTVVAPTDTDKKGVCFFGKIPTAVIYLPENDLRSGRVAIGTPSFGGIIHLRVEMKVTTQYQSDLQNAIRERNNAIGALIKGIWTLQETNGYMIVNEIKVPVLYFNHRAIQKSNRVQYESWLAEFTIDYGWPWGGGG
jgi:hypothetical protein